MPTAFYIIVPIAGTIGVLVSALVALRGTRATDERAYIAVALALGLSTYFALQFGLVAFVPGPGSTGPVQYAGGDSEAMRTFGFRGLLVPVALVAGPIVGVFDLVVLFAAARSEDSRLKGGAALACGLLLCGAFIAFTHPSWVPTA